MRPAEEPSRGHLGRKANKLEIAAGMADEQGCLKNDEGFAKNVKNLLPRHRPVFNPQYKIPYASADGRRKT